MQYEAKSDLENALLAAFYEAIDKVGVGTFFATSLFASNEKTAAMKKAA